MGTETITKNTCDFCNKVEQSTIQGELTFRIYDLDFKGRPTGIKPIVTDVKYGATLCPDCAKKVYTAVSQLKYTIDRLDEWKASKARKGSKK